VNIGCLDQPPGVRTLNSGPLNLMNEMPLRRKAKLIVAPVTVTGSREFVGERVRVDPRVEELKVVIVVRTKQPNSQA